MEVIIIILENTFDVYDFPGLIRCFAAFEGYDTNEFDITFTHGEDGAYAARIGHARYSSNWDVAGSIGYFSETSVSDLIFSAAHEIGHRALNHFTP